MIDIGRKSPALLAYSFLGRNLKNAKTQGCLLRALG